MSKGITRIKRDIVVIGGGPAGMAAATRGEEEGAEVMLIERDIELGGILNQCIHNGFGVELYGEELTGPEYAERFTRKIESGDIDVRLNSYVLSLSPDKIINLLTPNGVFEIDAEAVVLATGARERSRGEIRIPGDRPSGVMPAGTAQKFINKKGFMPGKKAFVLGSGDIGLIISRRLTWEGAEVVGVAEIMDYPTGLNRNVVQCLHDYDIPLHLRHTVTDIYGTNRLEGIELSQVDEDFQPIEGSEKDLDVDLLLLSVGLVPENDFFKEAGVTLNPKTRGAYVDEWFQTDVPGIFGCGNSIHIEDLVDWVTMDGFRAGDGAVAYAGTGGLPQADKEVRAGENVNYVVPHKVSGEDEFRFALRVTEPMENVDISIKGTDISSFKQIVTPGEMEVEEVLEDELDELKDLDEVEIEVTRRF
ncbi:FAD-dependent oxidoreductase [Candidatus Bipolaricaulota bacterium]|nr:FAD-dependent oxidoreductase [Candidatus Bipolaricaulota bacterium]